jgi:hypothetical protein
VVVLGLYAVKFATTTQQKQELLTYTLDTVSELVEWDEEERGASTTQDFYVDATKVRLWVEMMVTEGMDGQLQQRWAEISDTSNDTIRKVWTFLATYYPQAALVAAQQRLKQCIPGLIKGNMIGLSC